MVMVMIVIMMMVMIVIMMVVVMIVIMMVMIIVIVVVFMVGMMSHVGGRYTRQADRIMGMVVAVPLSRGRSGREIHSAKTSASGNREGYYSFTRHEERSFD
jgi:hypothetical protein